MHRRIQRSSLTSNRVSSSSIPEGSDKIELSGIGYHYNPSSISNHEARSVSKTSLSFEPVRKLFILVEHTGRVEAILVPMETTTEEVYSAIHAACEITTDSAKSVIFKLTDKDGAIVPISPLIPANRKDEPYHLKLIGESRRQSSHDLRPAPAPSSNSQDARQIVEALQNSKDNQFEPVKVANLLYKSSFPRQIYGEKEDIYDELKSPEFDIWKVDDNQMLLLFEHLFEDLGLIKEFSIDQGTLKRFLLVCKHNYNQNPFHNFRHAFCVCQMMYSILHTCGIVDKLTMIDKLVLLISCLGHDLDHPGYNNAYQVNAQTDLAVIYNDASPLENHHAAVLFYILKHPETNVLANIPDNTFRIVRKGVIQCILATDMAKHKDVMVIFGGMVPTFDYENADHRAQLLLMIIKCSDISNEVRPTNVSEPWVDCLLQEFFAQSDAEKKAGLPVAPFMDRDKVTKSNAQVGFIQFVLMPLFETLGKLLPKINERYVSHIQKSLDYYKKMQDAPK